MPSLHETQRLLWQLITAPEGVHAALAADADRGGTTATALARTLRSDAPLDAAQRLDIYANMYFFRILDVLKEDYPATHALFGDVPFHNLITDYLLQYPPSHFSIREAGRHLPEALAAHASRESHPCAADLGRFERCLRDAFDAADVPALTTTDLAAVPQDEWGELQLAPHPSVHLLATVWPVHRMRSAAERGEPVEEPAPDPTRLCVWRQHLTVFHRPVERLEFAALESVARGATFGEVCAVAAEQVPDSEAAQKVAAALARWIGDGWLAAPAPST